MSDYIATAIALLGALVWFRGNTSMPSVPRTVDLTPIRERFR